ncbi:hypothetical protein DN069_33740 [Streptacidiphilus pinicola]|uniref:Uncharacterized protein n=1 Tax=Streptacidiphilus pinicola TaxID=2219663 RepID=A0A2X0IUL8_9ACTN|nr:hypothetical protein [Streptacidiphilus pinicola]RAG81256.1 hypothetical protein DN069_33740 [Streptacidiphilus pinicola]
MTVLESDGGVAPGIARIERIDGGVELGHGWAVRLGQGSRGRLALEVYADEALLDVMVEGALTAEPLRGARRAAAAGPVLSWGLLPADGVTPLVRFGRGDAGEAVPRVVAERFWIALGPAGAERVSVATRPGADWEELRISAVR